MKISIQQFALFGAASILSLAFAACSTTRPNAEAEKEADKPVVAKQVEPVKPTASPAAAVQVEAADKIGVAECDDYIQKYEACVTSRVPQAQRAVLQSSFEQSRQAWKQAAATAQGKASLSTMCKQAMDAAKQSTAAYGCAW